MFLFYIFISCLLISLHSSCIFPTISLLLALHAFIFLFTSCVFSYLYHHSPHSFIFVLLFLSFVLCFFCLQSPQAALIFLAAFFIYFFHFYLHNFQIPSFLLRFSDLLEKLIITTIFYCLWIPSVLSSGKTLLQFCIYLKHNTKSPVISFIMLCMRQLIK